MQQVYETETPLSQPPEVYLKRALLGRDYMLSIREDQVDMERYNFWKLLKTGPVQECGSVGCLAGWLQTMPEFREWVRLNYHQTNPSALSFSRHVEEWLLQFFGIGISTTAVDLRLPIGCMLKDLEGNTYRSNGYIFGSKHDLQMKGKDEAIMRMEVLADYWRERCL